MHVFSQQPFQFRCECENLCGIYSNLRWRGFHVCRRSFQRFAYIYIIHINRPLVYRIYRLAFVFIRVFGLLSICFGMWYPVYQHPVFIISFFIYLRKFLFNALVHRGERVLLIVGALHAALYMVRTSIRRGLLLLGALPSGYHTFGIGTSFALRYPLLEWW